MRKTAILAATALGGTLAIGAGWPALAADVSYERLTKADGEPQNWLTNHRTYDGQRFSPLAEVTRDNVKGLKLAYAIPLGGTSGNEYLEATPLVDDGFMYTTDGWGVLYKIDLTSGEYGRILWRMDPSQEKVAANRGAALLGDKVFTVAADPGRVLATNRDSGEVVWETNVQDQPPVRVTGAPLAVKNMVITGMGGGDSGARGWLQALSAEDGSVIWKAYTIPEPGQPGSETWKDDHNAWQTGGGATWLTGTYDPEANSLVWGIGQPAPDLDPFYRPGDNLYTASTLAFDVDTGAIKWYFQYTPNDMWDFDAVNTPILFDGADGAKLMVHSARNGFLYTLNREDGQFMLAQPYLENVNWTAGIDAKTGKPVDYDPTIGVQVYSGKANATPDVPTKLVCPGISGGNNFFPSSYSPKTGMIYIPALRGCQTTTIDQEMHTREKGFRGGNWAVAERNESDFIMADPLTGEVKGRQAFPYPNYSGALSTAGGVVFTGLLDGTFLAFDDTTMDVLWKVNLGTGFTAPPMSYAVNGKQYVLISSGLSGPAKGKLVKTPEMAEQRNATVLWVFSL